MLIIAVPKRVVSVGKRARCGRFRSGLVGVVGCRSPPESNGALPVRYSLSKRAPWPIGQSEARSKLGFSSGPFLLPKR